MPSQKDTHIRKAEEVMATRPIWRGHLRLALVNCPIALHAIIRASAELHFHFINPKTGHRVRMVTLDSETDEEVARRDLVKGYEFEKNRYVLVDDEDFEHARIETSSTMTVGKCVDRGSIDPIWFDSSYYVAPDGEAGQDVFVVLRDALQDSRCLALSRIVVARRERAVAILPMGKGMVCHTLHEPRELYDAKPLFDAIPAKATGAEMVRLARQLIERQVGKFAPEDSEDRYETRLREVIHAKLRGEGITPQAAGEPSPDNVIDLMAALKASLNRKASAKTPQRRQASPARKDRAKRKARARKRA
jgi:DNA end-binding protein Ku